MAKSSFAAIDLGAESGRVVLGTIADGRLDLKELHRFSNGPVRIGDELHWDVLRLWAEMKTGVGIAGREAGGLAGIGIDTWGVDFGLLGRGDVLLGNPYHYRDARTNGMLEKAFDIVPKRDIFDQTGIQFMQFNTVFQLLAMQLGKSVLLDAAETMLMMPDLFNYWFTGRKCIEFSNATTTQAYNPTTNQWATKLIEGLGIPSKIFPEIVASGTVLANVRKDIAEELGIGNVPLIAPAQHDTGAAVAAVPAERGKGWAYLSSGTWSLIGVEVPEPIISDTSFRYNFTNEGGVGGTYRFLKNIMGLWLVQECRRTWQRQGQDYSYAQLAEMAGKAKPFLAILNPDESSFLPPGDMPSRIVDYCQKTGQTAPSNPGEFVRVCLESLALTYRQTLERIAECTGTKAEVIHIVGGGSQNQHLNQWAADATGCTVVAGPVEATAAGNIAVQALAAGLFDDIWAAREVVRRSFDVAVFEPADAQRWEAPYKKFEQLRKA